MMESGEKKNRIKRINETQIRSSKMAEMLKTAPRQEAVEAFRRKAYCTKKGGDYNELGR